MSESRLVKFVKENDRLPRAYNLMGMLAEDEAFETIRYEHIKYLMNLLGIKELNGE